MEIGQRWKDKRFTTSVADALVDTTMWSDNSATQRFNAMRRTFGGTGIVIIKELKMTDYDYKGIKHCKTVVIEYERASKKFYAKPPKAYSFSISKFETGFEYVDGGEEPAKADYGCLDRMDLLID